MTDDISVLVVDDSALMRNLVSKMIEETPGLCVAEKAMNGIFALQKIPRVNPDIIVLDLEMPEMNGIEFLRERKRMGMEIPVIILSSIARRGAEITMEALSLGASDFIKKPSGSESADIRTVKDQLTDLLLAYGRQYRLKKGQSVPKAFNEHIGRRTQQYESPKPVHRELPQKVAEKPQTSTPVRNPGPVELIAIGISTGGPNALREVFAKIDPNIKQPILVVQHMPAGFTEEFAKSLDRICPLEVKEAQDGDLVKSGRILIAPGDYHMYVEKKSLAAVVHLSNDEAVNGHRPSADVLFASVAKEYGNHSLGIIMTGMGRDGAKELGSIRREGGRTIGQNEESCIVYGMPKVAYEMGHVMEQVSLQNMAARISEIAAEKS